MTDTQTRRVEPIPFFTLPNWVKAAAACGFNIEPIFREYGIPTDLIHIESVSVNPLTLDQVMEACVARSRQQDRYQHFPFVLGERFAFDYLPDIETFLTTSANLREASRVFEWVRTLINPMLDFAIEERGDSAYLLMDVRAPDDHPGKAYFVEALFASVHKFFKTLTQGQESVGRLSFKHVPPPYAEEYERYFGLPVAFGQSENAAIFARGLLDTPLGGAFPSLHKQAEYLVERRIQSLPKKPGVVAAIETVFADAPRLLGQGIAEVARQLGMEPRTLQRRLQEQGQSFAELQAHARYRLALRLLETTTLDIETISEKLGFSDRRSFTRAFQQWNGMSPSEFRARSVAVNGGGAPTPPVRAS